MTNSLNLKKTTLLLLAVALLANGWLFISDGFHYDAWIFGDFVRNQNQKDLMGLMDRLGLPVAFYFHWPFYAFKNFVFAYNFVSFFVFFGSGLLIFKILHDYFLIDEMYAFLIATFYIVFPAFEMTMELALFPYFLCYLLFWLATWLVLKSRQDRTGLKPYYRVTASLLFFISFTYNATLPIYATSFFLIWYFDLKDKFSSLKTLFTSTLRWVLYNFELVSLPFIYWTIKNIFWIRSGDQADYNSIKPNMEIILDSYSSALHVLKMQIPISLQRVALHPLFFIFSITVCYFLWKRFLSNKTSRKINLRLLVPWLVLQFIFSVLPYAIVQLRFNLGGREGLYALVLSTTFGIAMTLIVFAASYIKKSKVQMTVAVFLISIFATNKYDRYIFWQRNYLKNESISLNLAEKVKDSTLIYVSEASQSEYSILSEFEPIWISYMLKTNYSGKLRTIATRWNQKLLNEEQIKEMVTAYKMSFYVENLSQYSIVNPQIATINYFDDKIDLPHYYYLKLFDQNKLESYLRSLTNAETKSASGI